MANNGRNIDIFVCGLISLGKLDAFQAKEDEVKNIREALKSRGLFFDSSERINKQLDIER